MVFSPPSPPCPPRKHADALTTLIPVDKVEDDDLVRQIAARRVMVVQAKGTLAPAFLLDQIEELEYRQRRLHWAMH